MARRYFELDNGSSHARPIPRTVPVVRQIMKPTDEMRLDLASDGKRLLVAGNRAVFELAKTKLVPILTDQTGVAGLAIRGDEIWVACYDHVLVSRDRGATFDKLPLLERHPFYAIACTDDGVWVAGHEGAAFLSTDGKTFTKIGGMDKATFKRGIASPLGALLLKYNGRLGIGRKGKLKATPLRTKSPLLDACVTASGAIVIVGHGDWKGAAYRTEDGETFAEATLPIARPLQSVACLPDGRIIVGSQEDELLVSYDDGRSFEVLEHAFKGAKRNFDVLAEHQGAIYAAGSFQHLLEIR